ncbi:MAG: hypothetical protein KF886_12255 [Candidatus Hydrogenedentes bacterium]|nr:hypothetical protein [Candidatus Hydrogenedentota bacterium]
MLRTLSIASLVLVNFAVWTRPADYLMTRSLQLFGQAPTLERAEHYAVTGKLAEALAEYQKLAETHPENPKIRYEYGMFCYLQSHRLLNDLGTPRIELARAVRTELYASRTLQPANLHRAREYAIILMDETLFRDPEVLEPALEAWRHVKDVAREMHAQAPDDTGLRTLVAQSTLQLARVEARFGSREQAREHLAELQAISPNFRASEETLLRNARMFQE